MFISEADLLRRVTSEKNLARESSVPASGITRDNVTIIRQEPRKNRPRLSPVERTIVGTLSVVDGATSVANELGLSRGQVKSAEAAPRVKANVERVREIALTKLMDTLGLLTPESMVDSNPKDLSIIASNLGRVVQNTTPKDHSETGKNTLVIYAPHQKADKDYTVIDI